MEIIHIFGKIFSKLSAADLLQMGKGEPFPAYNKLAADHFEKYLGKIMENIYKGKFHCCKESKTL